MRIIGHKGCHFHPNTTRSVKHVLKIKNLYAIEIDIRLCKNNLIVFHDEYLKNEKLINMTYEEIKNRFPTVPALNEILDIVDNRTVVFLDIKIDFETFHHNSRRYITSLTNTIEKYIKHKKWKPKNFIVSSFHHIFVGKIIEELNTKKIHIKMACSYESTFLHMPTCDIISINYNYLTTDIIEICKLKGIELFVFVVNDEKIFKLLKNKNVDAIITDFPLKFTKNKNN